MAAGRAGRGRLAAMTGPIRIQSLSGRRFNGNGGLPSLPSSFLRPRGLSRASNAGALSAGHLVCDPGHFSSGRCPAVDGARYHLHEGRPKSPDRIRGARDGLLNFGRATAQLVGIKTDACDFRRHFAV
jgi:hypothetical protein